MKQWFSVYKTADSAACKIYKELERQLKEMKPGQSPEQAIDILKTI